MEMAAQILGPGMQHQGERWFRPQPARIAGELGQGCRHARHERVVHPAVVDRRQRVEVMRQGANQMGIRDRQQFGHAPPGPILLGAGLAGGAVAVAAGVIDIVAMAALVAFQTMAAQGGGPAVEHGSNHLGLRRGQAVGIEIFNAEDMEHLCQTCPELSRRGGRHGACPVPGLMRLGQGREQI
jgi:hypothetical protein